jgi:type I restriction enzyme, S subunit
VIEENKLPKGWVQTTLGDLLPIQYGKGLVVASRVLNGEIPVYGSSGIVGFHNQALTTKPSLVIGRKGSIGSVYHSTVPCWPIDTTYFTEEDSNKNLKFFLHLLSFLDLHQFDKSTAIPGLSRDDYNALVVQVAPLPEQQRIVTAIEQQFTRLDAAVTALQHTRTKLKRYRAAVLKAAVEGKLTEAWRAEHPATEPASALLERILVERRAKWEADLRAKGKDPAKVKYVEPAEPDEKNLSDLPKGWCWLTLEQLTSAVRPICYGILMPKENVPNGVLYVKVKDMKGDKINVDELHRTTFEIAAGYARASLAPGDLLLAIRGTYGRIAEVPDALDGANITQDTARLATIKLVSSAYVAIHLRSPNSQKYFREVARGVAVKGVNIADVRLTPIKLPPFIEQQEIVSEVERRLSIVTQLEITVEANLKRAERLRQSILKEAFAGRLVPQDPHDEPASVLLERIHKEREEQKPGSIKKSRELKTISVPRMLDVGSVDIKTSEMEQMDLWTSIGSRE